MSVTFMGCMSGTWIASKILWLTLSIATATGAQARRALRGGPYPHIREIPS
jgi:hypothetical protein